MNPAKAGPDRTPVASPGGGFFSTHASRADLFTESVIREMTRLSLQYNAINLAQGFPDFSCPPELKAAACEAVLDDVNQYAITWGARNLREALSERVKQYNGMFFNPETEITVTCGSTEAMMASMLAVIQPGDEVVVPEPFYENYGPDAEISGAVPRFVPLMDDFSIDEEAWKAGFTKKTRAIILNSPNNPTGKVFSKEELRSSLTFVLSTTRLPSQTRSMNISFTTGKSMFQSDRSTECRTVPSPSGVFPRPTASPGGVSDMPLPDRHHRTYP